MATRARRRPSTRTAPGYGRRTMMHSAYRRVGHDHAYALVFWDNLPGIARAVAVLAAFVALVVAWFKVAHVVLGVAAFAVGCAVAIGWVLYQSSHAALQRRQNSRSHGAVTRGVGLGYTVAALVAMCAVAGWASLWSPWA